MIPRDRSLRMPGSREAGSALILVLFACLAVAVVVQALTVVTICAERAVVDEAVGRQRLEEKDQALAGLRQKMLSAWRAMEWTALTPGENSVEVTASELSEGGDWVMSAAARQAPSVSRLQTSAWLERGRDGIDLPLAAVAARAVTAAVGRVTPWVDIDDGESGAAGGSAPGGEARIHVVEAPFLPVLGPGCAVVDLAEPWRLDPGWALLDPMAAGGEEGAAEGDNSGANGGSDLAGGPDVAGASDAAGRSAVVWISGRRGGSADLPADCGGLAPGDPVLIVVTGGVTLDARSRGNIYGVVVIDEGSLLLDGTTVHGAVFATGVVDLGESGCVRYSRSMLRWAGDRSLSRVRLVPGTRSEGME
jgi:hypothetical protein